MTLAEPVDDDRATLLGAFLALADQLRGFGRHGRDPAHLITVWRRRGLRAFDADKDNVAAAPRKTEEAAAE